MIILGYGTHLDGMVSANCSQFFSHIWDAGHLVELASADATKLNEWVSNVTAKVIKKFFPYIFRKQNLSYKRHSED